MVAANGGRFVHSSTSAPTSGVDATNRRTSRPMTSCMRRSSSSSERWWNRRSMNSVLVLDPDDRHRHRAARPAEGLEVRIVERPAVGGHDAHPATGAECLRHPRHLEEAAREDRDPDRRLDLMLEDGQVTAASSDDPGAGRLERPGGAGKGRSGGPRAVRRLEVSGVHPVHQLVPHREGEGRGVADVSGEPHDAVLLHHDPDRLTVDRPREHRRLAHVRSRGSSASRRPSPRRTKPSAASMIDSPGKADGHHWPRTR